MGNKQLEAAVGDDLSTPSFRPTKGTLRGGGTDVGSDPGLLSFTLGSGVWQCFDYSDMQRHCLFC